MSGIAINEPEGVRERTLTPASPNEPPALPEWATEPPVVTGLEPTECTLGDPDFRIYVSGTGFYEQSTLVFAGQDEPTTFEDGKLSTGVNMAVWHGPDTVQVGVRNGPIESNTMPFTFKTAETPEAEGQWRTTSVTTATPPGHDADADYSDPDELEDELDQAREEGDFSPVRGKRR
jgi:hypothetical protein